MDAAEFDKFRHDCVHDLMQLNESCGRTFNISSWERYDYDLDRGTLTFSHAGTPRVIASIIVTGTTSQSAGDWLWSWANGHMPEKVSETVKKVRDFSIAEGISELTEPCLRDDEHLGWAMTAIAARVLDAKGAYRCPRKEGGYMYMLYTEVAFADKPKRVPDKDKIECDSHGNGYATYVCEHLLAEPAQKWFSNAPTEEDPWPDSWCAACEILFQEQGEWNRRNEKMTNIKVLCHCCYEKLRAQHLSAVQ
jgi:hypothetical protein